VARGPRVRHAAKGIPSGPGDELPDLRMARLMSRRRIRQSRSSCESGGLVWGGREGLLDGVDEGEGGTGLL
jgi:hypothetical protein